MIYETVALYYVKSVNPVAYCHATQMTLDSDVWGMNQLRSSEKGARHWDTIKDHKLVVPLEDFDAFWRQRYVVV